MKIPLTAASAAAGSGVHTMLRGQHVWEGCAVAIGGRAEWLVSTGCAWELPVHALTLSVTHPTGLQLSKAKKTWIGPWAEEQAAGLPGTVACAAVWNVYMQQTRTHDGCSIYGNASKRTANRIKGACWCHVWHCKSDFISRMLQKLIPAWCCP